MKLRYKTLHKRESKSSNSGKLVRIRELEQEIQIQNRLLALMESKLKQNQYKASFRHKEIEQEHLMYNELIKFLEEKKNLETKEVY